MNIMWLLESTYWKNSDTKRDLLLFLFASEFGFIKAHTVILIWVILQNTFFWVYNTIKYMWFYTYFVEQHYKTKSIRKKLNELSYFDHKDKNKIYLVYEYLPYQNHHYIWGRNI